MMDWTTYFDSVIDLTTLLLGVIGILITFILRDTESQWRRFCIVFFSAMILKTAAALIGQLAALYWKNIPLQTACDFLGVLFSSTIIPNRGAWIEYETNINDVLFVRIDKNRKLPLTVFIRALGIESREDIYSLFGEEEMLTATFIRLSG